MTTRVGSRAQSVAACLDLDDGHKYGCEALRPHSCHVMSLSSHTYMHASYHSSSRHYSYMYCTAHLVVVGTHLIMHVIHLRTMSHTVVLSYAMMRSMMDARYARDGERSIELGTLLNDHMKGYDGLQDWRV
jgi:hypothetical protein